MMCQTAIAGQRNIIGNGKIQYQAFRLSVFCHKAKTIVNGVFRLIDMNFPAMPEQFAGFMGIYAENGAHNFCSTSPHETGYPQNFTFSQIKGNILKYSRLGEMFYAEHLFPWNSGSGRIIFINGTANHIRYNLFHRRFFRRTGADGLPISHNGDGITVSENFLHTVGNIDNGYALFLKASHYFKKSVGFPFSQCRCRLIHDDHPGISHKSADDFHHLLLTNRAGTCNGIQW